MKEKIKIGIIGAGRMGITHFSIINSHPNVKVTCIADPSKLISNIFKKYVQHVKVFKDYKSLLKHETLDGLLVCTPPHLNYDIIKSAYESGIHVFVEKPFTLNLSHAKKLDFLFSSKGLINQVGYVNRFNDVFTKVKSLLEAGIIGDIARFKCEMFSGTIINSEQSNGWRMTSSKGGGALYEMASHAIDLVNYLIGKPNKVAGSCLNRIYSKKVIDAVSSTFLYGSGITGTLYVNWCDETYRKPTNKIEILGKKGKILADQHSIKIFMKSANTKFEFKKGWNKLYITDLFNSAPFYVRGNEYTNQLYSFVESILNQKNSTKCNFKDGIETLEIIDLILKDNKRLKLPNATA